ncbi:hypothetical protein VNO77_16488 [Canavalia gladiata]|uniref:Uncharacterized protein n=1 Tax=Canavalia gladiata TaxID=3824 RepID=A0AAN9QPY8_CANGL
MDEANNGPWVDVPSGFRLPGARGAPYDQTTPKLILLLDGHMAVVKDSLAPQQGCYRQEKVTHSIILTHTTEKVFWIFPMPHATIVSLLPKASESRGFRKRMRTFLVISHSTPTRCNWLRDPKSRSKTGLKPPHVAHPAMAVITIRHVGYTRRAIAGDLGMELTLSCRCLFGNSNRIWWYKP